MSDAAVPIKDLFSPDFCFHIKVNFGDKFKESTDIHKLDCIICGLCNACGGNILVTAEPCLANKTTQEQWQMNLGQHLRTFMTEEQYNTCIHYHHMEDGSGLCIVVVAFASTVTVSSQYYKRKNQEVFNVKSAAEIVKALSTLGSTEPLTLPQLPSTIGEVVPLQEGEHLELKCWKCETATDYKRYFLGQEQYVRTRKGIFSILNVPRGGHLVIGVKEEKKKGLYVVKGQEVSDKGLVESYIDNLFKSSLVVQYSNVVKCSLKRGEDYEIQFLPLFTTVGGVRQEDSKCLIVLQLMHSGGVVFETCPESYVVTRDGTLKKLECYEWLQHLKVKKESSVMAGHSVPEKRRKQHTTTEKAPSEATTSDLLTQPTDLDTRTTATPNADIGASKPSESIIQSDGFSWIDLQPRWDVNLTPISRHLRSNVDKLSKSSTLNMETPVNFFPCKQMLQYMSITKSAIQCIEDSVSDVHSLAIATKQWTTFLRDEPLRSLPSHHFGDIVVMTKQNKLNLWVLAGAGSEPDFLELKSYTLETARLIKMHFIRILRELNVQNLSFPVRCCILQGEMLEEVCPFEIEEEIASTHNLTQFACYLFLGTKTFLKSRIEGEITLMLTAEQMETLLSFGLFKFNCIEGPPGSGKTVSALHLRTKYHIEEILWLVTTKTFAEFLKHQGVINVFVMLCNKDLQQLVHDDKLRMMACIIVDDVHNTDFEDATWKKLFDFVENEMDCDLYIFGDNDVQNYKTNQSSKIKMLLSTYPAVNIRTLSECHRNSRKVAAFIQSCCKNPGRLSCSHDMEGDDIEVKAMEDITEQSDNNQLIAFLKSLTDPKNTTETHELYDPRNIAILIDMPTKEENVEFCRIIGDLIDLVLPYRCQSAMEFPVTGIIVDELEQFLGLDAEVCIFIIPPDPKSIAKVTSPQQTYFEKNPKYRAFIASRAVSRVVFVQTTPLTSKISNALNVHADSLYETFQGRVCLLWETPVIGEVSDLTWVRHKDGDNISAILYAAEYKLGLLKAEDGTPLTCPISSPDLSNFTRVSARRDGTAVVLAGGTRHNDDWWCVFKMGKDGTWSNEARQALTSHANGIDWVTRRNIAIVDRVCVLSLYTEQGELLWSKSKVELGLQYPERLAVDRLGHIYIADWTANVIRIISGPDEDIYTLEMSDLTSRPRAVCVTTGGTLFLLAQDTDLQYFVCMMLPQVPGSSERQTIILSDINPEDSPPPTAIALSDRQLAVGYDGCIRLYQID